MTNEIGSPHLRDLDPRCEPDDHCITCSDDGTPMRVLRVDTDRGLALCADSGDAHSTVEIALVEPVVAGEVLLIHAGTAIARIARIESGAGA